MKLQQLFSSSPVEISQSRHPSTINEIKMSPSSLEKLSSNIDVRIGMEFELFVPSAIEEVGGELSERTMDLELDSAITSVDQVVAFFDDGDVNSSVDFSALQKFLDQEFENWQNTAVDNDWEDDRAELIYDYLIDRNVVDKFQFSKQYKGSDDVESAYEKHVQQLTQKIINDHDNDSSTDDIYDRIRANFAEANLGFYSESQFFDAEYGAQSLYDLHDTVIGGQEIFWPYYQNSDEFDAEVLDLIARDFGSVINKDVRSSTSADTKFPPGVFGVVPDGSIDLSEGGVEIVTPPLPIDQMLKTLHAVRKWANSKGAYTNTRTGLHMNISVEGKSMGQLDYLKLVLLLGDKYILSEFGRTASRFAHQVMPKVMKGLEKFEANEVLLDKLKNKLSAEASELVFDDLSDKYYSIYNKGKYIEFRGPGNDYLGDFWDKVVPTMLRMIVALDAALDENKYAREYETKLYKLFTNEQVFSTSDTPRTRRTEKVKELLTAYLAASTPEQQKKVKDQIQSELQQRKKDKRRPSK